MNMTLQHFREEIDDFMEFHPQSPLDSAHRDGFKGLAYYSEDPKLAFTAVVDRLPDDEPLIEMETSTGEIRQFRRWGIAVFEVEGEPAKLTIYSDPAGGDFFLPFKDSTNGQETYGAGRYLDNHRPGLQPIGEDLFEIDFNFAYNPYCAYSPYFSCPLPPRENWLTVPMRAGEKAIRTQ